MIHFINTFYCPDLWKNSYIIPIYKKSNTTLAENYRPISILPSSLILFETILSNHLIYFIRDNNLINDNQYCFLSGKSTDLQLLECYRDIFKAKDNYKSSDIIYIDMAKAFDKVSHKLLFHKLFNIGIQGYVLKWIKSYLFNRIQSVNIDNNMSKPQKVISGVPRGSVLGPIIFIIYINDLPDYVEKPSYTCRFSDDAKIGHIL